MRSELEELIRSGAKQFSLQLGEKELEQFSRYLELIQECNQRFNLTAISDEQGIAVKHFLDSLAAHPFLKDDWSIADFGSGMGCPGIPLKIARPGLNLILLESNRKKSAFIGQSLRELNLGNARSVCRRAEDRDFQNSLAGQLDAVLARALGKLELILKLAAPYLKQGGIVIAYKGPQGSQELLDAKGSLSRLGFQEEKIYDYELPFQSGNHKLLILKKR